MRDPLARGKGGWRRRKMGEGSANNFTEDDTASRQATRSPRLSAFYVSD